MIKTASLFLLLIVNSIFVFAQADFTSEPIVKWKFKTRSPMFSSPVIIDQIVYFGGLDSTVYALDINSGKEVWTVKTNGEIRSTPVVVGDRLYLVGGNGVLSCLDKNSGKLVWRTIFDKTALFLAERKYDFADYYTSSPVVYDGVIYFGSGNGYVRAVKAANGELIWNYKAGDIVHTSPVIYKDKIYFGAYDGYVYSLVLSSGSLAWKFKTTGQDYFPVGEVQGSLAVSSSGLIHVGSRDYNIYSLDAENGYSHWTKTFDAWALSHSVKDSVLYVGTSDNRVLIAYDAATGRQHWKTNVKFNIFGGSAFTTNMLYVGTIWGKLYGVDRKSGEIRWSFAPEGHAKHHDKYFKKDDSFRDDIGSILKSPLQWIQAEYSMGGIFSTPAIAGDLIIVTSTDGFAYGLSRQTKK